MVIFRYLDPPTIISVVSVKISKPLNLKYIIITLRIRSKFSILRIRGSSFLVSWLRIFSVKVLRRRNTFDQAAAQRLEAKVESGYVSFSLLSVFVFEHVCVIYLSVMTRAYLFLGARS